MRAKFLLLINWMCCALSINAQNVEFAASNFPDQKKELKDAYTFVRDGNLLFEERNYVKAIPSYRLAYSFNPRNAELNFKMGVCTFYLEKYKTALTYLTKAESLDSSCHELLYFYIGRSCHILGKFEEAIEAYQAMINGAHAVGRFKGFLPRSKKGVAECQNAIKLKADPVRVWVDNLGEKVNTIYPEYRPLVVADETQLFWTARRNDGVGGRAAVDLAAKREFREDVFYSRKTEEGWKKGSNMGETINSRGHEAGVGISSDGRTLFVFRADDGQGDIYQTNSVNGFWGDLKKMGPPINSDSSNETSACLGYNGRQLYFTSDREGGFGDQDIWVCNWDAQNSRWGEAQNLGPVVNTKYKETSVFLHADGRTMYFASEGHNSIGGLDIFVSRKNENNEWGVPMNVGYPLNSPKDDVSLVLSGSGRRGYFASNRYGGFGKKDLYMVTFLGSRKEPVLESEDNLLAYWSEPVRSTLVQENINVIESDLLMLTGVVSDARTHKAMHAKIQLVNNRTGKVATEIWSDKGSGQYLLCLPAGSDYAVVVSEQGYLFESANYNRTISSGFVKEELDIQLQPIRVGKSIRLGNVFFKTHSEQLTDKSEFELERLVDMLESNTNLRVLVSGHVDSENSVNDNVTLSRERAKSVVDYLLNKGINSNRLDYIGYGNQRPIISTERIIFLKREADKCKARKTNNRVEVKIISQ